MTEPEIKVTRIKDRWHARMLVNGEIRDEMACDTQCDIGLICRTMLRWYQKLGGASTYASKARHRGCVKPQRQYKGAQGKIWYLGNCKDQCKAMSD